MKVLQTLCLLVLHILLVTVLIDAAVNRKAKEKNGEDQINRGEEGAKIGANGGDVQTAIKQLMKALKKLSTKIKEVETNVGNMDEKLLTLGKEVANLKPLKTDVKALNEAVSIHSKEIKKIQDDIAFLHGRTTTVGPSTSPGPTWRPTTGLIYFPEGTTEHSAPKCIDTKPKSMCFVGYGYPEIWKRYCATSIYKTFKGCFDYCYRISGNECKVDGVMYHWSKGMCSCINGSAGHKKVAGYIHYRY